MIVESVDDHLRQEAWPWQAALDRLMASYFEIQDKLTKDEAEDVPDLLRAIREAAASLGDGTGEPVASVAARVREAAETLG